MKERVIIKAGKRWRISGMDEDFPYTFFFLMCYSVKHMMGKGNFTSLIMSL